MYRNFGSMVRKVLPMLAILGAVQLRAIAADPSYRWQEGDGSLALVNNERVVWQFNFKKEEGKPFFHPLTLTTGTCITALRPGDHPWHRGLWWSWKFINGVNYWEENKKTGLCDGRTDILSATAEHGSNFSARVALELSYHLPDKEPVMTEKRVIRVSPPDVDGNYSIDWTATFTAGAADLKLDRTPPHNFSGGYAGLSCRMSKDCIGWTYTGSEGLTGATNLYGQSARWIDFSKGGGIAILDHPGNLRHPTTWYPNEKMPFFSPALLFKDPYVLEAGKMMTLRYRVWVHSSPADKAALATAWSAFAAEKE